MYIIKRLFFYAFLLLLIVVLVEILLSIAFGIKDRNVEAMHVKDFPYLYYLFEPSEGLNEDGFKTTYNKRKPKGVYRIVMVGGSVVRGREPQHTIAAYLEQELQAVITEKTVEVINAGISAFVVEQEFLLIQLIIQQYEPDMIVGLDGYNDLHTYRLNRMYGPPYPLPPHNWNDFRVVADNRYERGFLSRFTHAFKSINRVLRYYERQALAQKLDWQKIIERGETAGVATEYQQLIQDTRDFCSSKHIRYVNFLQPVDLKGNDEAQDQAARLLYEQMADSIGNLPYGYSLKDLLAGKKELFIDECHMQPEGHALVARAMADSLASYW